MKNIAFYTTGITRREHPVMDVAFQDDRVNLSLPVRDFLLAARRGKTGRYVVVTAAPQRFQIGKYMFRGFLNAIGRANTLPVTR